jgi:secreted trypsin-like serine protease
VLRQGRAQIFLLNVAFIACSLFRYPGVYTRVSRFKSWIDSQVVGGRRCKK